MDTQSTSTARDNAEMPSQARGAAALMLLQAAASGARTGLFAGRSPAALREASARYRAQAAIGRC